MSESIIEELKTIQEALIDVEGSNHGSEITPEINVFSILGIDNKEVLMCRMLGAILDPESSLNDGEEESTGNVKLFFEKVLGINDLCKNTQVILEDRTDHNRRCDILIKTAEGCYPIEVKIYAKDQEHQLFDYFVQYFKDISKPGKIYYLTPSGKKPSKSSISKDGCCLKNEQFCPLSFVLLRDWLKEIKYKDGSPKDHLITQYTESINSLLAGKEMDRLIEEMKVEEWSSCEVSYAITHILAMDHTQLWRKVVCSYLRETLDYSKDEYELVERDEEETDSRVLLVLRRRDNKQWIIKICVETNLYIVACCDVPNEQEWKENKWKYIAPHGEKKPYMLKGPGIENCHKNKKIKIDIKKDIDYVKKFLK